MMRSRRMWFSITVIAVLVLAALLIFVAIPRWTHPPIRWGSGEPPERYEVSFEEKLLATVPEGITLETLGSITGGAPSAGVSARILSNVSAVFFSPDGRGVLFVGRAEGHLNYVFWGDKKFGPFPKVENPTLSPGGQRLAFIAWKGEWKENTLEGSKYVVYDGKYGPEFTQWIAGPSFSPDGTQIAYHGCSESRTLAFVGDRRIDEYDGVGMPVYSPDGKRGGFPAEDSGRAFMVIDNRIDPLPNEKFTEVGGLTFSPDGRRVAYAASRGPQRWVMVIDGKPGEEFSWMGPPIFSADGAHVVYMAMVVERECVVRDGAVEGPAYSNIRYLTFSPDGRHLAYLAKGGGGSGDFGLIVDGQRIDHELGFMDDYQNNRAAPPVFSPDGRRVLARVRHRRGSTLAIVEGGKVSLIEGANPEEILDFGDPVFSPDGGALAYLSLRSDGWHVVAGQNVSPAFDHVWHPVFSPDGKRVAFGAQKGRELWWKVMDVK